MLKKLSVLILAGCFFSSALSMNVLASDSCITANQEQQIEDLIEVLQNILQTAEPSDGLDVIETETQKVLEGLRDVLENDDYDKVPSLIFNYAAELEPLQSDSLDNCTVSLIIGVGASSLSLVTNLSGEGGAGCIVINEINTISDIMIKKLSYDICVMEKSETPDEAELQELQSQQLLLEGVDFATSALDLAACNPEPNIMNYFSVFMNFLDLIPKPDSTE